MDGGATDIVGTWRLTRYTSRSRDQDIVEPFGSQPLGQLIYSADGGMSAVLSVATIDDIPGQAGPRSTEQFIGYSGWWSREADLITHHITVSHAADQIGQAQVRHATLNNDCLVLSFTSRPVRGEAQDYQLTWRKMQPTELGRS